MAEAKKAASKKEVKETPPVPDLNELNKLHREGAAKRAKAEAKK